MRYTTGCFAHLPYDNGGSLARPKTQRIKNAGAWIKRNASLIGLIAAVVI